jgi:DNA-binding NarL/FixJ family response regulator
MKVLVADPQPTVRHALSVWIVGQLGWSVVGESSDSFDLLDKLNQLVPEVVIIDRDLPGISTKELVAGIRQGSKAMVIILLSNSPLEQSRSDKLDVDFFVSKIDPPARTLDTFLKAESWIESKSNKNQDGG